MVSQPEPHLDRRTAITRTGVGVLLGVAGLTATPRLVEAQEALGSPVPDQTITPRQIQTNGISMHIAEAGAGPLMVLVHG